MLRMAMPATRANATKNDRDGLLACRSGKILTRGGLDVDKSLAQSSRKYDVKLRPRSLIGKQESLFMFVIRFSVKFGCV